MTDNRPACRYCGKKLRKETRKGYGSGGSGYFCSQRCGFRWAVLWHEQQKYNQIMGEIGNG